VNSCLCWRRRLSYIYFASDGATSRGFADVNGDVIAFPADRYVADGSVMNLRSTWRITGPNAFSTLTEVEQSNGAWREMLRFNYVGGDPPHAPQWRRGLDAGRCALRSGHALLSR